MNSLTTPSEYSVQCEVIDASKLHRYWWNATIQLILERPETARVYSPQELHQYYVEQLTGMGNFYEVRLMFGGIPVGMAIVVPEQDPHVGVCMTCMLAYVQPEHRAQPWLIKSLNELAKASSVNTISWVHRVSKTKYNVYYRRVR